MNGLWSFMKGNFEVKSMIYSISSKHFRALASMLLLLVPEVLFAQYLPDPEYSPLKIRVNLIIVQRADGSGNFQDNAADRSFLRNMMHVTNGVFADLTNRNEEYYPGQNLPFLSNAKLEFVPNIVFVKNETGWNNRNDTNASGVPYLSGWGTVQSPANWCFVSMCCDTSHPLDAACLSN